MDHVLNLLPFINILESNVLIIYVPDGIHDVWRVA